MKKENGEYPLSGVGIMRASGVYISAAYMLAASSISEDWFRQWGRE